MRISRKLSYQNNLCYKSTLFAMKSSTMSRVIDFFLLIYWQSTAFLNQCINAFGSNVYAYLRNQLKIYFSNNNNNMSSEMKEASSCYFILSYILCCRKEMQLNYEPPIHKNGFK